MFQKRLVALLLAWPFLAGLAPANEPEKLAPAVSQFIAKYCVNCHGDTKAEAELHFGNLLKADRFDDTDQAWRKIARTIERQEMPPKDRPQPPDQERADAARAIRLALKAFYARTASDDPGEVVLRRLTNAEYDYAVQDLTGAPLAPAWRFPRNESAGEGFDNVAVALGVRSSALIEKYLEAGEEVASHAFMQPSRGLVFSRLTSEQSSRPQRAHEACGDLKAFYEEIATMIPRRADLARALFAAWQFRHRERFGNVDLAEFARNHQVDPRYVDWLWRQLHDKQADVFQRQFLQEPFAALATPKSEGGAIDAVKVRCQRIAEDVTLALHSTIGQSLKELPQPTPFYMQGRHEIAQSQKAEWRFSTGETGGLTIFLTATDAGVTRPKGETAQPYVIWENLQLSQNKRSINVGELLKEQQHPLVSYDRLPDGRKLGANEFAVPVPSLVRVVLPAEMAPAKSGFLCGGKFRLAEHAGCVAQIGMLDRPPTDATGRDLTDALSPGHVVTGVELRAAGDLSGFNAAWQAYDEFFQRFAVPYFPTEIDLDTAPRNGFPDAIGIYAVYGIAPERHLHRFAERDAWLKACVLTPDESRRLDGLWDDVFYLTDEHQQRLARLVGQYKLQDLPSAEQEAAIAKLTDPEIRPRETSTWNGHPNYYRLPEPPATRYQSLWNAPNQWEQANRARSQAELLKFADRAWRRPLTADEQRSLCGYYLRLRAEGLDDEPALRRTIVRILVSPHFLLKVEGAVSGDQAKEVSANELAARLSFFLWSSLPDADLRAVAADGSLLRDDVLRAQTLRMLRDERAKRLGIEFFGQWLGFKGFDRHDRTDRERFPEFTDDLRREMYDESALFFDDLIRNDRSVRDVFFGDHTFLNVELALHYSLDPRKVPWPKEAPPGYRDDWANHQRIAKERAKGTPLPLFRVEVDPRQRGGVLGMGSVLTAQSLSLRTSPVNRGKWLYESVLGREIPEPPADAGVLPEDDQADKSRTLREQLESHRTNAACASCHARFDPLGFALERFDAIGRHRDKDAIGRPIDDAGELAGEPVVGLKGVRDYLAANEDELLRNFSRKLVGFALGRAWQTSDELLIDEMRENARKADESFANNVTTIVLSPQFRRRRAVEAKP